MKDLVNTFDAYQKQIDDVFGCGTIAVHRNNRGNHVIGTWKYAKEFRNFRDNYIERVKKLRDNLHTDSNVRVLHNLITNMGNPNNWEGTYAELVAYDILKNDYNSEYNLDVTRKATFALASKMGMEKINYDVYLPDYGVYMDVKAFTDTISDMLNNSVISVVRQQEEFKSLNLSILLEHPLDESDRHYKQNIRSLQLELANHIRIMISEKKSRYSYASTIVNSLRIRILLGEGVNSSLSGYSPYRHAETLKDFIIQRYCKKFPLRRPFFLVFVNFRWYNQITNDSFGFNKYFYRSIARRTYIQYEKSKILANSINPKYVGKGLAKHVARKLSGIIFIDDNSIVGKGYNAYIYTNPNATKPCGRLSTYLHEILRHASESDFDDFLHDNY